MYLYIHAYKCMHAYFTYVRVVCTCRAWCACICGVTAHVYVYMYLYTVFIGIKRPGGACKIN